MAIKFMIEAKVSSKESTKEALILKELVICQAKALLITRKIATATAAKVAILTSC